MSTVPRHLDKYALQQRLGRGRVGEVWHARDLQLNRDVAIKVFQVDLQTDPGIATRFTQEGQEIAALQHPNIVPVRDIGISSTSNANTLMPYSVMDYIEGPTLADFLRATSHKGIYPSVNQISYLFTSLGVAIDYAHQHGIVHGNIKPSNILLNKKDRSRFGAGEPMLTDFGLNRLLGSDAEVASPIYMAPEQVMGQPANNRSDIYSLGVILYELCTGIQPFRDESSVSIMMQHTNVLPTPPILINADVPPALSEVILRALSKEPVARFAMASLLATAITDASSTQNSSRIIPDTSAPYEVAGNNQQVSILGVSSQPFSSQPMPRTPRISRPLSTPLPAVSDKQQANLSRFASLSGITPAQPSPTAAEAHVRLESSKLPAINQIEGTSSTTPSQKLLVPDARMRALQGLSGKTAVPRTNSQPLNTPAARTGQSSAPNYTLPRTDSMKMPATPPVVNTSVTAPTIKISTSPQAATPQVVISPAPNQERAMMPLAPTPLPSTSPLPNRNRRLTDSSMYMVIAVLVLLLIVLGSAIGTSLLLNNQSGGVSGHVFFQDDALGHDDTLHIEMKNVPAPTQGKSYFVWLEDSSAQLRPLGAAALQDGTLSFAYPGDTQHTNLLSLIQGIVITQETSDTQPASPSGSRIYRAAFDTAALKYIKGILYSTPGLPANESALVNLFETVKSMNDKAGSIADVLQGNHDYGQVRRQAIRIIEQVDGTAYARVNGDLPQGEPGQLGTRIGLLSSPTQPGYLDILSTQLDKVEQAAGNDQALLQHVHNVRNAITDLKDWVQKIRMYAVQIVKAADLSNSAIIGVALQLKKAAADSYTGRTLPPNDGPQPVLGSAGAYQAYVEAQYMAALELKPVG
ncbi:serine/threonine protein kinase [Ktedonosporobacter rubrisoli]|uniref:non-specific serine/threonine protein kinase n=1 Tax=Ktedonosporobacter rubrisoli TaxID=2509675 RepID=A0A4P6JV38_KTERU|nr:serine/threonine-protein kinase [Ktedonosporobacter rubrisoli]QBD79265.1 serine/threonine protein kinase [Ktedonosporobacter rubrisoli]